MHAHPIPFAWDGDAMVPLPGFRRRCDEQYVIGERYLLEPIEERSAASHRHFFAAIRECWMNLPDRIGDRFSSPEALRKHALVQTGYRDERSIVCASRAEAQRVAAFVRPMDDFAVVTVREAIVVVYTAKSQSMRAMGREEFGKSKEAVLDYLASLIGTDRDALAGTAA
jgi:hypothetical protein